MTHRNYPRGVWPVRGEPPRERDLLVVRVVEQDDELSRLAPDLLDPVTKALRNEAHVPRAELRHFHTAVGAEDADASPARSEEHTSELQSQSNLVCRLLLE